MPFPFNNFANDRRNVRGLRAQPWPSWPPPFTPQQPPFQSCSVRASYVTIKPLKKQPGGDMGGLNCGIYLVRSKRHPNSIYVEKRITLRDVEDEHMFREVRAMQACEHRNIVRLIAASEDTSPGYGSIYMEYCELGALDTLIDRYYDRDKGVPEAFVWSIFRDLSLALCYLQLGVDATASSRAGQSVTHRQQGWSTIHHRDIKPGNCLLTWSGVHSESLYPKVVLCDFGCSIKTSHITGHVAQPSTSRCAMGFVPPEYPQFSHTGDIYMLGLTMNCLTHLSDLPTQAYVHRDQPAGPIYTEYLQDVLRLCLRINPTHRMNAAALPKYIYAAREKYLRHGDKPALPSWVFG